MEIKLGEVLVERQISKGVNFYRVHYSVGGELKSVCFVVFGKHELTPEEIKQKVKEWEGITEEPHCNDTARPPLGVTPKYIWIDQRIEDLARAIHEYVEFGRYEPIAKWAEELTELLKEREKK